MKLKPRLLTFAAFVFTIWSTPARANMVLMDANTPPCPILVNAKDNPLEGIAASQLAAYLKKITGKAFEIKAYTEPLPERAIIIRQHGDVAAGQLGEDGFLIKTKGQQLYITGGGAQGTFYGVFDFLEKQLGCRFWSWNEEDVPQRTEIKIGDIDIKEIPAFVMHDIMSKEAQNTQNYFVYKSRAKSTLQFTGNHTLYPLLTPAAKANPEFWPMNDKGVRAPNNLHFNYLAPGIDQALADALAQEVEKRKGDLKDWIYFGGQGDWYGGLDQSEASKQAYAEDGITGPLVQMINRTAAILDKKYPGIQVGTFAYMTTDQPPLKTVPAENVNIWLPRLRYGTTLSIEEAASEKNLDEKSRQRSQAIKSRIEKWAQIAPGRFYIWEYGANYKNFLVPWPSLNAMAQNIKYYKKIGVTGVMIQSNYASFGGDLAVLKNWIWSRLLWNPDQDVSTLLKQFCDGYYGPASADIQTYVNTLEEAVRVPQYRQVDEFGNGTLASPEANVRITQATAEMKAAIERARAQTEGEGNAKYRQRVNEVAVSLEAAVIWTTGPLIEKDGKLIRADINKAAGGEYTHERAMVLAKSTRGSGISEYGDGRSQVRTMIANNGGPLYTLQHGGVTAKIAPYQGINRLWSVALNNREIISSSFVSSRGTKYFVPVGEQTAERVEIEGEAGYGNWTPLTYFIHKEVFTQDADGTLHWDSRYQPTQSKKLETNSIFATSYPAANIAAAQKYVVEYKSVGGWKPIPFVTATRDIPIGLVIEPNAEFQIRIITPDKKVVITDTYSGTPVTNCAVTYDDNYAKFGAPKSFKVYVRLGLTTLEPGKGLVPAYRRTVKVEAAPQ